MRIAQKSKCVTRLKMEDPFFTVGVFPEALMVQTVICVSTWQAPGILLRIIKSEINGQI